MCFAVDFVNEGIRDISPKEYNLCPHSKYKKKSSLATEKQKVGD